MNGKVLVEFDLRKDVIDRLATLDEKVDRVDEKVADHIAHHEREEAEAAARRARLVTMLKRVGAAVAGIVPLLAALREANVI